MNGQFEATPKFDLVEMGALMRRPEIYWSASDALAPPPTKMNLEEHMLSPFVWTMACTYNNHIIGYVQLVQRTSIGGEIHAGFREEFRGVIAKGFIQHAIGIAFKEKGFLKLWAIIPSDNRAAIFLVRHIGFEHEGRLTKAIVRNIDEKNTEPLRDLVILSLSKPAGN